jgi:transposase
MRHRRLVGIDLGITSAHTVCVLDESAQILARRRAWPSAQSLGELEEVAMAGIETGTRLEVVIEPTGPAWLPIAVFFIERGHLVYRVSSAKAADLRRFLSRHAKSNGIDAMTLARLPLVDPGGVRALELPGADAAALDRRVRVCDRLTRQGALHKRRLKDLVRQLMPLSPLHVDVGRADLAVLERAADPHVLLSLGEVELSTLIARESRGQQGVERAREWIAAATASLELYGDSVAMPFAELATEVATEVRLLHGVLDELAAHELFREHHYRAVDPEALARSLPGVATVGAPALVATMGSAKRFNRASAFRSFTGLAPKASETGESDRKGQPISKAGNALLRTTLIRAADHARREDPQLARIYYVQMVERGKNHLGATCVVAAHLAERFWRVMVRATPYVICDVDGRAVSMSEAKAIIAERYTVTEEVRRHRRSKKGVGKAPQKVLAGHFVKPHAKGVGRTRRPSPTTNSVRRRAAVKHST